MRLKDEIPCHDEWQDKADQAVRNAQKKADS